MSEYVWIRGDGEEVRLSGEQGVLAALYSGQIADEDLVRVPETGKWVRARELKERIEASMGAAPGVSGEPGPTGFSDPAPEFESWEPPEADPDPNAAMGEVGGLVERMEAEGWSQNNAPWRRYFARIADFSLVGFGLLVTLLIFVPDFFLRETASLVLFVLLLVGMPLVDALFLSRWHTSPGKWMLSVRTVPLVGTIGFEAALSRSWSMIVRGMWFSIPLLAMIPLIISCSRASKGERLAWEQAYGTVTMTRGFGWPFLVFLAVIGALLGLQVLGTMAEQGMY